MTSPDSQLHASTQQASAAGRWIAAVVLRGHLKEIDGNAMLKMAMWLVVRCGKSGIAQISIDKWTADVGLGRSAYFEALNSLVERGLIRRVRAPGGTTTTTITTWIQLTEPAGLDAAPPVTPAITLSLTGPPPEPASSPPRRTHQSATADSAVRDGGLVRHGGLARPGISARPSDPGLQSLEDSQNQNNDNDDSELQVQRAAQVEQVVVVLRAEGFSEPEARRWAQGRTLAYCTDVIANANHQAKFGFKRSRKAWIYAALARGSDGLFVELEAVKHSKARGLRCKEISDRLNAAIAAARGVVERWPESRARRWALEQLKPIVNWHLIHAKWVSEDDCLELSTKDLAERLLARVV